MAKGRKGGRGRPPKQEHLLLRVRAAVWIGRYRDTRHAGERREERGITLPEVRRVLEDGWHEAARDSFQEEWKAWNYAIRGRTVDRRDLRIVVSFDDEGFLLIITAIDLKGGGAA